MSEASIPGVKPIRKTRPDGRVDVLYYHRKTGRRLPDDPTSTAFKTAVAQNDRDAAPPEPEAVDTIRSLILRYQAAPDWTALAPYTREVEQSNINAIDREFGDFPLEAVEERGARALFLEWRDEMAEDTPRGADAKLVRLAKMFKFAFDLELIGRHPLATFKRIYRVDRSEVIWLPEHFRKLGEKASPALKLAAFLALHTGQRRGDLLGMRWRQFDGDRVRFKQRKTGARVDFRCTRALRATLDRLRGERQPEDDDFVLLSPRGVPWTINSFRSQWAHAVDVANLPAIEVERDDGSRASFDLHFHDIRGTAVTMLAEAGCTIPEIAAITGHSLAHASRILERYLGATKAMADAAIAKLELRMIG